MSDAIQTAVQHAPGRLVNAAGTRFWVEIEGQGEPLIVLAGGPAQSHIVFHPVFSQLSDRFQIIYYDYRGRGRSERPADWSEISFEGDVEDLEQLRIALGLERISLYGFSYGGIVAQAYALRRPERVRRLVLANTVWGAEMWAANHQNINREMEKQYPEIWEQILSLRSDGVLSSAPEMQRLFSVHSGIVRWYHPDHAALLPAEPGAKNPELYFKFAGDDIEFQNGGEVALLPDFRPRLNELTMPVLILAGRFDRALYPKLQMEFKRSCPQARFVMLERSGTWGHLEEPETVFPLLAEFLRQ